MKTGILCIFIITFVYLSAQIVTDFSTGLDNWIAEGDCNYFWYATGGNPTGYLRIEDDATGDINRCYAPAEFLGDWSGADSDDTISADIFLSTNTLEYIGEINYVFRISGPGGIAKAITDPRPTPSIWHTYSVSLDPEEWTITAGDWNSILEDVQSFVVTGEFIDGDEFDKIDNITLSFSPVNHPVKIGTISDFEELTGYDGWSFINTYWIAKEYSGGNPSNYLDIHGSSGLTVGVAPAKFTGSWELLVDNAEIMVDLKNISGNIDSQDPIYLFRISGDGGEAYYPVPDDFHLSATQWNTYKAMITEDEWNIVSGDWDSLIQNVTNVKIALDFYASDATIGMDNFRVDNEVPQAFFSADKTVINLGEEIFFTDYSTNSPDSWFWQFGDGTSSNLQNPSHIYQQAGIYDVTLTATNIFGSDTLTREEFITVNTGIPENIAIQIESQTVHLSWDAVQGADFYNIYSSDNPNSGFDLEATTTDTNWTTNTSSAKKFYYVTSSK